MWTIVQFALLREGDYRAAFDLLGPAGFKLHRAPDHGEPEAFPAAVAAETFHDPAVITRAVFEELHGAGLAPVAVAACHAAAGRPGLSAPALARA